MPRNKSGKPSRRPRPQVGQVPHNRTANGFSAPPTTPFAKPYSLIAPKRVNVVPITAGISHCVIAGIRVSVIVVMGWSSSAWQGQGAHCNRQDMNSKSYAGVIRGRFSLANAQLDWTG